MRVGAEVNKEIVCEDLRRKARRENNGRVSTRLLAIANVLDGMKRGDAARQAGMSRLRLRDWIKRYNENGIEGLRDRPKGHVNRRLTAEQEKELKEIVEQGPNGLLVRWRWKDLKEELKKRFGVEYHERTIGKILNRLGFSYISVRPIHPRTDIESQESFKKNFAVEVEKIIPEHAQGKSIELWFQDEARIGQQGTLTRLWAKKGTRPRVRRDQRRANAYIFGAVCPSRDTGAALVLPCANTESMNLHLAEISAVVKPENHAVIVTDNAGWHISKELKVPKNLSLMYLPPYSPELNAQENIWQYLRQNFLAGRIFETFSEITDACSNAWNALISETGRIKSIASRGWFKWQTS